MKLKKSAGPDNLTAEHLKFGGQSIIIWLTEIFNSVVDVEQIPTCLKLGITIPVYKGGGKDPLNVNSYRGITLNSVISKVLETLILNRLEPVFMEAGLPHPNQSAYRKSVSCADAIFATQEVINRYLQEGGRVYMCLYDLEKAFDSVEFSILLKRLLVLTRKRGVYYKAGILMVKAQYVWGSMYPPPLHWVVGCDKGPFCHHRYFYWLWTPC